jgi:hypothetical protein
MALDTRLNAVHGINRYIYEKGKQKGIFPGEQVYQGRSAFAPVNQIGAYAKMTFNDAQNSIRSVPYIVYNWTTPTIGADYYIKEEQAIYFIYSTDLDEIRKISNFIEDNLKQGDRSATNVQAWLEKLPPEKWGGLNYNPYLSIELYNIAVDVVNGPSPIEEAGGRMEAMITLTVRHGFVDDQFTLADEN